MNRIDAIFAELRRARRKALMPFVCAGHPTPRSTPAILSALERGGASIAEIGIPFSDPIADGPVIASAMHQAISAGVTPASALGDVHTARRGGMTRMGVVAMVSISIVHRLGVDRFATLAHASGVDGLIIPDCPAEEAPELTAPVRDAQLTLTLLVAPTTPPERAERIVAACTGFVYLLTRAGITGDTTRPAPDAARPVKSDDDTLAAQVARLRTMTDLPIACGFGIASAEQVRRAVAPGAGNADAAIVGSALVKRLGRAHAEGTDPADEAEMFVRSLGAGLI